jgi:dephospho-CoA kinase
LGEPEAEARIRAQATREERLAAADVVLENNGTPAELAALVDRFWAGLESGGSSPQIKGGEVLD